MVERASLNQLVVGKGREALAIARRPGTRNVQPRSEILWTSNDSLPRSHNRISSVGDLRNVRSVSVQTPTNPRPELCRSGLACFKTRIVSSPLAGGDGMPAPNRGPRLELERGSHFAPCCERERTLPIGRAPGAPTYRLFFRVRNPRP